MILGTGVDIAEVPRIRESIERFGDRFLRRVFTEGEVRYCEHKATRYESFRRPFCGQRSGHEGSGHRMEPRRPLARH